MILIRKKPTITRVKMLMSVAAVDWSYDPGQIVDLPSELAENFIATGKAIDATGEELAAGVDTLCPLGHNRRVEESADVCIYCARM